MPGCPRWGERPQTGRGLLGWLALLTLVGLASVGASSWWRRTPARERTALVVCWAVGWGTAVLTWLAPGLTGWASAHIAGAGNYGVQVVNAEGDVQRPDRLSMKFTLRLAGFAADACSY